MTTMDSNSLSHLAKSVLLARFAFLLTVSARSTYEVGTENILESKVLRAYNELMHRVTSSIQSHVEGREGMPFEAVLETMKEFGVTHNRVSEINWVLKTAQERPLPTTH